MTWPWLALVGLGAFHGANPAMGWLFAVALGLHRRSRRVVLESLIPIALGHALATGAVVLTAVGLGMAIDQRPLRVLAGTVLIGWAVYHQFFGRRHRLRVGMRTGMAGLLAWSFVMASAHGAGLMLVPIVLPLGDAAAHGHLHGATTLTASLSVSLLAVAVHTLAMLVVTGVIAVMVHDWIGLAFLRRGWINLDRVWTASLAATGSILLLLVARS
jgi:hypothetical protein